MQNARLACYEPILTQRKLWEELTMNPIVLQARMVQSAVAYWQAMYVMQKQWFESMTRLGVPAEPEAPAAGPGVGMVPQRRLARA